MHTLYGIAAGVIFVLLIIGLIAGGATVSVTYRLNMGDCAIGAFSTMAILFVAVLIAIKVSG